MKRTILIGVFSAALVATACTNSSPSTTPSPGATGKVVLQFWDAQTDTASKVMQRLAAQFNATHPNIEVQESSGGVTTGDLLPKVTAAMAAGTYPDIAYIYGSYAANIAKSGKTADLSSRINEPGFNWNDLWPASKQIVAPGGKVIGFPALIDNLSVIYNKKLFDAAGIPAPSADWTWDDFRAVAKELTDSAKHIYGVNYPVTGDLDTVWRFFPGLWQRGGEILSPDQKQALFNSQGGVDNLTLWQQMATVDKSVYLDPTDNKAEALFTSNHLGMFVSGPWEVATLMENHVDFGDQILPGVNGDHTTVSGPDNWVIFDHGQARVNASVEFLKWLTAPQQELTWMMGTGSLPIRPSIMKLPQYQQYLSTFPGIETMAANLVNAKKAMPTLPQWPRVVDAIGQSVAAVLLGKAQPGPALDEAAQQADAALIAPQ